MILSAFKLIHVLISLTTTVTGFLFAAAIGLGIGSTFVRPAKA